MGGWKRQMGGRDGQVAETDRWQRRTGGRDGQVAETDRWQRRTGGRDRQVAETDRWQRWTGGILRLHTMPYTNVVPCLIMATAPILLMELQFDTCSCTAVYGMYGHTGHILMFLRQYVHIDASP